MSRPRLSYANVTASLALFLALGGGAYAATQLPKNSVTSKQVKPGSIQLSDLSKSARSSLKGAVGPRGGKGEAGEVGPSDVYSATVKTGIKLPGQLEKVASVSLPAGSYLGIGKTNVLNSQVKNQVRCVLNAAGTDLDVADLLIPTVGVDQEMTTAGAFTLSTAGDLSLYCATGVLGGATVLPLSTGVFAIKVGAVH